MELETDKAVVEVPSSVSGVINDVRVKVGEKISVGQVIFTVDNGTASVARAPSPAKAAPAQSSVPKAAPEAPKSTQSAAPVPAAPSASAEVTEFKLPELGEGIHQGDLVRLIVSPGASIAEGDPVMEIETDKAVVEVPSSVTGMVKDVLVKQGEKIKVGQVIFTLQAGATSQAPAHHPSRDESHEHERSTFQAAMQSEGKTEEEALPPDQPKAAPIASFSMPLDLERAAGVDTRGPVPAAPHVRRLARELGVDIHNVAGSGPGGRISEDDVKAHTKALLASGAGTACADSSQTTGAS